MLARYPLIGFFALAYLITWTFHILAMAVANNGGFDLDNQANYNIFSGMFNGNSTGRQRFGLLLFNIGQFGPVVAAFIMTAVLYGRAGVRDLARRMVRWRVEVRWYLFVLLLPFVFSVVALLVAFITGGFSVGPFEPGVAWAHILGFLLYLLVFTGIAEEPGWRGFALPHAQTHRTAYNASWVVGVGWGLWHLPFTVYYNREEPFLLIPALAGLVFGVVGYAFVLTWLYNATRSVWLLVLIHGWMNTVQSYLILSQENYLAQTVFAVAPWALAVWLTKRYGEEHLGDLPRPVWWPDRHPTEHRMTESVGSNSVNPAQERLEVEGA